MEAAPSSASFPLLTNSHPTPSTASGPPPRMWTSVVSQLYLWPPLHLLQTDTHTASYLAISIADPICAQWMPSSQTLVACPGPSCTHQLGGQAVGRSASAMDGRCHLCTREAPFTKLGRLSWSILHSSAGWQQAVGISATAFVSSV